MPLRITKVGAFSNDVAKQIEDAINAISAAGVGGALADGLIIVGSAGGAATAVAMSGDASIVAAGAVTVVGINGAAITATGTEIDAALAIIDAIPTVDPADGVTVWNDAGVLKVASAA